MRRCWIRGGPSESGGSGKGQRRRGWRPLRPSERGRSARGLRAARLAVGAETTRLAAERTERERAEAMRLAVVRAEQERLAREEAERKKQEQAARHPQRKDYGGATRVKGERRLRPKLLTITGLAVALAAAAFFIGRYALERRGPLPPAVVPAPKTESVPPETARREPPPTSTAEGTGNISAPNTENPREPLAPSLSAKPSTIPAPKSESPARLEPPPETGIVKNPAVQKPSVPQLRVRTNPKDGLRYVWTPPGTFTMGCSPGDSERHDDEKPAHRVTITKGFWLGQTEVTQAAYQRVVGTDPSDFKGANLPVEQVSWDQAQAYCQAIGGRLPTEAEWEYAARAGSVQSRYGDIDRIAWYYGNSGGHTHEVAQKEANAWGLYDMLGNVWEWTADGYGGYAPGSAVDPAGPYPGNLERCGAGLGTMVRGTRACRTVAGSSQATVTTISGCGARRMRAMPAKQPRGESRTGLRSRRECPPASGLWSRRAAQAERQTSTYSPPCGSSG